MTQTQKTGPAQPDKVERPENQQHGDADKSAKQGGKTDKDDLPGADGFRTAGTSEDTYD